MSTQRANINNSMLRWAREDAGLSLEEAAQAIGIPQTKDRSPEQRLKDWEDGQDYPTHNQLATVAKAYFRPVLTFYLAEPPTVETDVADFRTVGDRELKAPSPKLRALISRMKAKQQQVLDLLREEHEQTGVPLEPLQFVGRFREIRDVNAVARDIEAELGIRRNDRNLANDNDGLFRYFRYKAEQCGVFVLAQGDLGHHTTDIDPEDFRGFALADPLVPFVVINDNDAKAARTFTLAHELAHLWIGTSGISNHNPFGRNGADEIDDEKFCNAVASELLLPTLQFEEAWARVDKIDLFNAVRTVASEFSISRAATAHRLWREEKISEDQWWALYNQYQAEWRARRARDQGRNQGGPSWYTIKSYQLGNRLKETVFKALDSGQLTYTRASRILGASPENLKKLRA